MQIPEPKEIRNINFPDYQSAELSNGIKLFVVEDHRYPLVTSRFVFEAGSFYDLPGKEGTSSMTAELVTKGTTEMDAMEAAAKIEYYGAGFSGGSDSDAAFITFHSLSKNFRNVFEIASSMITQPGFSEEEFRKAKEHKINSLISLTDEGEFLAVKSFREKIYEGTSYSSIPDGKVDSVSSLETSDLKEFYKKYYSPGNLLLTMVGDISLSEAVEITEKNLGGWRAANDFSKGGKILLNEPEHQIIITDKKDSHQADLCLGHRGVKRSSEDIVVLNFMNTLLGGYFSSRINKHLREAKGLTYGVKSSFNSKKFAGDFSVDTSVNQDFVGEAVKVIKYEIEKIRNEVPSEDEIQNVKNYITGTFPMSLETPNGLAIKIINKEFYALGDRFYKDYLKNVNDIVPEAVRQAAEKYLNTEKLIIAVCGDAKKISKNFSKEYNVKVIQPELYK